MGPKQKILITGAGGFLGGYILRDLIRTTNYNIIGLKRTKITRSIFKDDASQLSWQEADLLDTPALEIAMQDVDVVVHAAAMVSYHRSRRKEMYRINQTGTANLINIALDNRVKKIVHVSSIAALGRPKDTNELNEQIVWTSSDRNSHYAITKKLAELEVYRGFAEGLEGTILCPGVILGSGYWDQGTALFFKSVYKGLKISPIGHTGFVDVRDVSQAVLQSIKSPSLNDRLIINSTNTSYLDLLTRIANLFQKKPPALLMTKSKIKWLAPLAQIAELVLGTSWNYTAEILRNTSYNYRYNNQRSIDQLDMHYRSLDETLQDITRIWSMYYPGEGMMLE